MKYRSISIAWQPEWVCQVYMLFGNLRPQPNELSAQIGAVALLLIRFHCCNNGCLLSLVVGSKFNERDREKKLASESFELEQVVS